MVSIALNDIGAKKHFLLVKNKVKQRASDILRLGYINKDSQQIYADADCSSFLQCLLEDDFLENIICTSPLELQSLIDEIVGNFPDFIIDTNSFKIIYNVFIDQGYNNQIFDKLEFINNIGKDTCLYCNRN
jgi:hypothetical protein